MSATRIFLRWLRARWLNASIRAVRVRVARRSALAVLSSLPDKITSPSANGLRPASVGSFRAAPPYIPFDAGQGRAEMTDVADQGQTDRVAGGALIAGSLLSVLAMAHHPQHIDPNGMVGL